MKVLYVFGGEKAQGAEIVIERLMNANLAQVHPSLVLAPGKFADHLLQAQMPYPVITVDALKKLNRSSTGKMLYLLKAMANYWGINRAVYRYIKQERIAIVHTNTNVPSIYLLPLVVYCRLFLPKLKWLWSDHDMRYFSAAERVLAKLCARAYHRTLVVSRALIPKYTGLEKNIQVLYNGLNTQQFKPDPGQRKATRESYGIQTGELVIGMAAAINPDKGQLALIGVFNALCARFPNLKLVLAGDIASQARDYGGEVLAAVQASKHVIHAGYISNVAAFYNACDLVVNNSNHYRSESLGTSIYEAMACEKVVVASATGGTPEIVDDRLNGFLFEPEDMAALENCLAWVITNFGELDELKRQARRKVQERFELSAMTAAYNTILSDLIPERSWQAC